MWSFESFSSQVYLPELAREGFQTFCLMATNKYAWSFVESGSVADDDVYELIFRVRFLAAKVNFFTELPRAQQRALCQAGHTCAASNQGELKCGPMA